MKKNRIKVIEPLGTTGGMQIYNTGYLTKMLEIYEVHFYSSGGMDLSNADFYAYYTFNRFINKSTSRILRYIYYLYGAIFSIVISNFRKNTSSNIILHIYNFSPAALICLTLLSLVRYKKKFVIIHDPVSLGRSTSMVSKWTCVTLVKLQNAIILTHSDKSYDELLEIFRNTKVKINNIGHSDIYEIPLKISANEEITKKPMTFTFLGQIKPSKGLDTLLDAWSVFSEQTDLDVQLVIRGRLWQEDISTYSKSVEQINNRFGNVDASFDFLSEKDFLSTLLNADVLILPYKQVFSSAIHMRGASVGVPIICSDIMNIQDEILAKSQLVFEAGNSNSLVNCLQNMANYQAHYKKIAISSVDYVIETFGIENSGNKLLLALGETRV